MTSELDLYRRMLTVRLLEEELQKLCFAGEAGDLHFSKGQEAVSVGACAALDPSDYIVTHHRTIVHSISRGIPMGPLVAEVLGKSTGINHGMAGEMHLRYPPVRYMFSFQLVGTCVPVAAGVAFAVKYYTKEKSVVACFMGDAATSNGQVHEGLNIAAVRHLPLLIICENNGLAGNVRKELYLPTKTVSERAAAYAIEARRVDGNHLPEVMAAVKEASDVVRSESRPYLIEMDTTRLSWHKQGQPDSRSKEELEELAKRDPILYEEKRLGVTAAQKAKMAEEIGRDINTAIEEARKAPLPTYPTL